MSRRSLLVCTIATVVLALSGAGHQTPLQAAAPQRVPVAGITAGSFTSIGPGNIGGRARALAIDPSNPSRIFAGTYAGLWTSADAGASWSAVAGFNGTNTQPVSALAINPVNPSIIYAGTGEGYGATDLFGGYMFGSGIWKSTDGGATWAPLPATTDLTRLDNFFGLGRLAISADGTTLLALTYSGIERSTDGGATWTFTAAGVSITDVAFVNGGPGAVAIRTDTDALYSTDGGATWNPAIGLTLQSGGDVGASASSPTTPGLVYAAGETATGSIQVFKSTNGGVNYATVSTIAGANGIPDLTLWVDPTNANHLLVGAQELWRSTDGGVTFTQVSDGRLAPASPYFGKYAIVSDPGFDGSTNRRVYIATDGGIFKADDITAVNATATAGYASLNNGLNITQFYSAAGSPVSGAIVGGSVFSGAVLHQPGASAQAWTRVGNGTYPPLSGTIVFDPADANLFYELGGNLSRNTTGGAQPSELIDGNYWNGSTLACKPAPYRIACGGYFTNRNRVAVLDPSDSNSLLVAQDVDFTGSLWRTTNVKAPLTPTTGPVWVQVGAPASRLSALAIAKGDSAIMWVGGFFGAIYRTSDGLADFPTWTKITPPLAPTGTAVTGIAFDPADPAVAFVSYATPDLNSTNHITLWKTVDNGATWTDATGSGGTALPGTGIHALVAHPSVSGWLYAGTDAGLYASEDGGATWTPAPDGPVNVAVSDLSWMGKTLIVATAGRGIFVSAKPIGVESTIRIETPTPGAVVTRPFTVAGWAINESAPSGTGVDGVQLYAFPYSGAPPIFLGAATYGGARPDVAAIYGAQFTNSGYSFTGGDTLPTGGYDILAYAHNAITGHFDSAAKTSISFPVANSHPLGHVDGPAPGATIDGIFALSGWAIDTGAATGTGVDAVHAYAFASGSSTGIFLGAASYGIARSDVGAIFGSGFTGSGYSLRVVNHLDPGVYTLVIYTHSTVSGTWTIASQQMTRGPLGTPIMSLDFPQDGAVLTSPLTLGGWAIDVDAPAGSGILAVHVWALPADGGAPIFVAAPPFGAARADIAAIYGAQYADCGFQIYSFSLPKGSYTIAAYAKRLLSGQFDVIRTAAVTVQ